MSTVEVINPFNLEVIQKLQLEEMGELEQKISLANKIAKNPNLSLKKSTRIEILEKLVVLMGKHQIQLIQTAVLEGGKPITDTKVEILRAINGVKLAIEGIGKLHGTEVPMGLTSASEQRMAWTTREPIGVVAAISAFNHPINLIIHQVITAIAAGCPVIVKPALTTPLSCLYLIKLLQEAGLPAGWCQSLIAEDSIAELLATDQRIAYLTFIGSAKVGWYLRSKLAPGTRCALEHGGVAPVVIAEDVEIKEIIPALTKGAFYHAGQVCVSIQKIFVHDSLKPILIKELVKSVKKLKIGDPMKENTEIGPLILPEEVERVESWVNEAQNEGAIIECGGKRISETEFEATILSNVSSSSQVSREEIFGPVVAVYSYQNLEEVYSQINELPVAFQASIFTQKIDVALDASKKINASAVMINDHTAFRVDWMPFGGRDLSGIGTGGIERTMKEMTREKLFVMKSSSL